MIRKVVKTNLDEFNFYSKNYLTQCCKESQTVSKTSNMAKNKIEWEKYHKKVV